MPPPDFADTDDDLQLDADARRAPSHGGWSACEKWVWSCVRNGDEANLFARSCVRTRSEYAKELRDLSELYPFEEPEFWEDKSALGAQFVVDMLHKESYTRQLTPNGVRIVGAYFERQLSLENVTTTANLVIDLSIFKSGIRLTNFSSSKNVSFDRCNVRSTALMNRIRISGSLFLEDGAYDHIDLRDARIGASIDAAGSFFIGTVRLDRARVEGKVNFVNARLTELSGWDLVVGGSFWLRSADIRGRLDLTGARISSDLRMQKVTFGRQLDPAKDKCDWDLSHANKLFIDEINTPGSEQRLRTVLAEIIDGRPSKSTSFDMCAGRAGAPPATVAVRVAPTPAPDDAEHAPPTPRHVAAAIIPPGAVARAAPYPAGPPGASSAAPEAAAGAPPNGTRTPKLHEVRLRDMTIDGTLCLIDLTGEFGTVAAQSPHATGADGGTRVSSLPPRIAADIDSISIDGTQARSTIIRWKESASQTLWRAVQFKTGNMQIDLGAQPHRHYIDALELRNISFLRSNDRNDPAPENEDFYPYLCDMRPGTEGATARGVAHHGTVGFDAASRKTHEDVVKFFTSPANESRSVQPFAKIAERLDESGASSLYLKMELGDFSTGRRCSSSELFKEYERTPAQTWSDVWPRLQSSFAAVRGERNLSGWRNWIDESKNATLDATCRGVFKAYKYTTAYGHQPHFMFIVIAFFVVLFWVLLRLDTPHQPELGSRGSELGMLYAIDMFIPFVKMKMNNEHAMLKPQRRWLRGYLIVHRVIGLVLTSLLVLGFYVQRH